MSFHDPEVVRILHAAEEARERLADAIAGQPPERSDRAARHATDAIGALIPTGGAMTDLDLGADDGLDRLAARAAEVHFSHADQDRIQAAIETLAADPAMEGYRVGYPTWGLFGSHDIDVNIAATSTCPKCGRYGRGHAGFVAADGSHSWRGFAVCPGCGTTEEF